MYHIISLIKNRIKLTALPGPNAIYFEITDICNMKCPMCITKNYMNKKNQSVLTPQQIKEKILIPGNEIGIERFVISGGEPTLSKHLLTTIKDAVQLGYKIFFATNLLKLDVDLFKNIFTVLHSSHHTVQISFDSINREEINLIRGVDAFEKIKKNLWTILNLKKRTGSKIIINPSIVVQPENADSILASVDYLLNEVKVDKVTIQPRHDYSVVNLNNFKKQSFPKYSEEIKKKILTSINELFVKSKNCDSIYITGGEITNWKQFFQNPLFIKKSNCNSTVQIYIDPYGNYRGCLYAESYANVLDMDIKSYLESKYYKDFMKFIKICKICIHGCS